MNLNDATRRRLAPLPLLILSLACTCAAGTAHAGQGGILALDRHDEREDAGLFSRSNQKRLDALVIGSVVGMSLWEGTGTPDGRLWWKTLDSISTTAATTEVLKRVFQRKRPSSSTDPNDFFAGSQHKSFPSGETALMAAAVTPVIRERAAQEPAWWLLAVLPLYMGRARMASQGHWLSDVLVGGAVGVAMGWQAQERERPLVLRLTGNGVFVGWKQSF